MIQTQYRKYIREYQGRDHHLVSGKSTKHFFVHVTEQKIVHNFTKRGMTLVTITTPPPRVILSIGGRIHMPNRTIEVGTEFIIGHVRM